MCMFVFVCAFVGVFVGCVCGWVWVGVVERDERWRISEETTRIKQQQFQTKHTSPLGTQRGGGGEEEEEEKQTNKSNKTKGNRRRRSSEVVEPTKISTCFVGVFFFVCFVCFYIPPNPFYRNILYQIVILKDLIDLYYTITYE